MTGVEEHGTEEEHVEKEEEEEDTGSSPKPR